MLKKSASVVLASFKSSTYPRGNASGLHSLRPCLRRGVSWHAWAGRVRPVAMLRIPYDSVLSPNTSWLACRPL